MNKQSENYLKNLGRKLALVLSHDEVETASKHAIEDIILHAQTETNDFSITHPDLIAIAFPMIIEGLKKDYGIAVCHSLKAIYETLETQFEGLPEFHESAEPQNYLSDDEIAFNSKRIVAEWLLDTHDEPQIAELIEKLIGIFKSAFDFPMETAQDIVDCLACFDEEIDDDRDYEPAHEAAGIMSKIVMSIRDEEMTNHFINVYDFWLNPEGGDIGYSQVKGRLLAEMFLDIMENPNVPTRIGDAMLTAMADVFNEDLTSEQRQALPELEGDRDADYIDKLFRAYEANQTAKESERIEDDGLKDLSAQISGIVNNPLLPPSLYNAIVDEISEISEKLHTPENVLHNLKVLRDHA